ncbi:lipopolysaccharide heptosyltransferase II [Cellvibrio japonicus]|nr:lipopolysaccharide heptosyltransferase II [Cellvibrio japonicus]
MTMDFPASLKAIRTILIVGPAWIGDMMMAQSLFILLKRRNPQVKLHLLASAWTRPLVAAMPEIDEVIDMPFGHGQLDVMARYRLGKSLADRGYDQAILLPNSFKSALVPFFAGIPLRTGWRGEMRYGLLNDWRPLDKKRYPLMVQRYLALAYARDAALPADFPYPQLQLDPSRRQPLLTKFALHLNRPLLILCPGAEYGSAKRWPEAYYATVAAQRIRAGWQVWLLGSAKDQPVAETIRDQLPPTLQVHMNNLAGRTNLGEAIALMACADAVLSNDSGLMHIAAALNRPLVVVFGSTSPEHTPPLSQRVRVVTNTLECSPCFERECPLGHHKCLRELKPAQVQAELDELLASPATVS